MVPLSDAIVADDPCRTIILWKYQRTIFTTRRFWVGMSQTHQGSGENFESRRMMGGVAPTVSQSDFAEAEPHSRPLCQLRNRHGTKRTSATPRRGAQLFAACQHTANVRKNRQIRPDSGTPHVPQAPCDDCAEVDATKALPARSTTVYHSVSSVRPSHRPANSIGQRPFGGSISEGIRIG